MSATLNNLIANDSFSCCQSSTESLFPDVSVLVRVSRQPCEDGPLLEEQETEGQRQLHSLLLQQLHTDVDIDRSESFCSNLQFMGFTAKI